MAVQANAGTHLSISLSAPATFNVAGYEALTFAKIGEVTDTGEHGRKYEVIKHNPVDTTATQKYKGSFDEGSKTIQMAIDRNDPGQKLVKQALNSTSPASFCVTYPDGSIDYFQALVMGFPTSGGTVNNLISASITLELTTSKGGVGIVEFYPED